MRPAAYRPGTAPPSARRTCPVSSATTRPPRVSTGAGLATAGRTEQSISENGGWSWARTWSAGLPAGSGPPAAAAALWAATVAASPAGSTPARRATASSVAAR